MSNTIFITANWTTGALSQQTISRQYDNNRYAVQFIGYPEGDGTEELDLYLLVWMSTAPGQKPGEITPIQLNSDQWYISNYFTQQVQVIKFQLCVLNEAGTYEAHSPIFSGRIGDSLEHNGTSHDIDVSTLFDAYRKYIEELIIAADAAIIDPVPTQGSSNAVSSGGVYSALADKVAKPFTSPNGTSGQLLRTLGNGKTEWTDFATPTSEQVGEAVGDWLDDHPEATTTVQDGAITEAKLADALKLELVKNYITPEMYGAVGDGVTNDSTAIRTASQHGVVIGDKDKTYFIGTDCHISNSIANLNLIVDKSATISAEKDNLFVVNCDFKNNEFYPDTGRGFWILSITNSDNVTIENCHFHEGVSAIYIDRCTNVKIHNNTFMDFRQYGLNAGGNGYGILLIETQNVIISNNIFRDVARHSIYISHDSTSTYCENILIDGNIFEWDSAVVGNTTGFEVTISIRPAKYITISNNLFLNMFAVCEFAVQEIYVGGTLTAACSQHVTINSNKGSFANHPRHSLTGVIFAPADETYSTLVAVSDVNISNNVFTIKKGVFVCCNALNDVCIKNNVITFELKTDSHVFCAPSPKQNGLLKTIVFDGNRIEGAYTLFRISAVAQNVDDLIIANNHIDVTALANCVSGTTFKQIKIINNDIVSENDRTYFSSATVEKITLKGNTSNKRISLYLVATSVLSTDPCFIGYGFNSSNPSDCVAGAIHTWYSGEIYIMGADGNWHLIT